jgi:metal-responsive CopG/Arc/MetJ family transcriptional regulator
MVRVNVITSITPELDKEFSDLCERRKLSRSAVLRELIIEFVERNALC